MYKKKKKRGGMRPTPGKKDHQMTTWGQTAQGCTSGSYARNGDKRQQETITRRGLTQEGEKRGPRLNEKT